MVCANEDCDGVTGRIEDMTVAAEGDAAEVEGVDSFLASALKCSLSRMRK